MFGKRERFVSRVLIVEDEPLVAFDNEHFLNDAGYEVVATVDTVADALPHLTTNPPDLVLTDVALSDGSGIDVARHARAHDVPVIFVTGACPPDARSLAIGCLTKPYGQRDLLGVIEAADAVLAGRKPRRLPRGFTLFDT